MAKTAEWYSSVQLEEMRRNAGVIQWRSDGDGDLASVNLPFEYHVIAYHDWPADDRGECTTKWQAFSDSQDVEWFNTQAEALNYCQRLAFERAHRLTS